LCQQTAGLVARVLEENHIPTVTLNLFKEIAEIVKPPRTLFLRFPYGSPLGQPNNKEQQIEVLKEAFELLTYQNEPGVIIESKIMYGREKRESS
jgi:D-proline reductase (dithiol) PrdB